MKITKVIARKIVFPTLMGLGIDKLIRKSNNTILNVMYHGVVIKDSTFFSPRHIEINQFEAHLKYFKDNFEIISLQEAFDRLKNNKIIGKNTITISFDDGFKNNLITALPLLEKYNIPTTFFVSSICSEDREMNCLWSEYVAAIDHFYKDETIKVGKYSFKHLMDIENNISMVDLLKTSSVSDRDQFIDELVSKYNLNTKLRSLPTEIWSLLNKKELFELSNSEIVTIGSHGHFHYNLGEIDIEKARNELSISKEILEKIIGKPVDLLAYPDGSYTDEVKKIAEKEGYIGQMAVNYKLQSDVTDKHIMNRFGISSTTTFASNMIFLNKAFKLKGLKNK